MPGAKRGPHKLRSGIWLDLGATDCRIGGVGAATRVVIGGHTNGKLDFAMKRGIAEGGAGG